MSAGTFHFIAEQGVTFNPILTYRDATGALVDLTGVSARMQVRESYEATTVVLDLTTENGGITLGGALGTIALSICAEDMSAVPVNSGPGTPPAAFYVYDLELVAGAVTQRLLQGKFTVTREVTR